MLSVLSVLSEKEFALLQRHHQTEFDLWLLIAMGYLVLYTALMAYWPCVPQRVMRMRAASISVVNENVTIGEAVNE